MPKLIQKPNLTFDDYLGKIYFTCHPDDFDKYFNNIYQDLRQLSNYQWFYTENLEKKFLDKDVDFELGIMDVFVVLVTSKLLMLPNRAMDFDIQYAKKHNIPILPIMLEDDLEVIYHQEDKFGKIPFFKPHNNELEKDLFKNKVQDFLDAIYLEKREIASISKSFTNYIYLSYCHFDRQHVKTILERIHSNEKYLSLGIFYNDYLKNKSNITESLLARLNNSSLILMLVTPQILENTLENSNYIMKYEYPKAITLSKRIIPIEMEKTSSSVLKMVYQNLPNCIDESEIFNVLDQYNFPKNFEKLDVQQYYWLGLAYLFGIDVERNRQKGIELITLAAGSLIKDAMYKLYQIYCYGIGVEADYQKAIYWLKRYIETASNELNLSFTSKEPFYKKLIDLYNRIGLYEQSIELYTELYNYHLKYHNHFTANNYLYEIGILYTCLEKYDKALNIFRKAYQGFIAYFSGEPKCTILTLNYIGRCYEKLQDFLKALEIYQQVENSLRKTLHDNHPLVIAALEEMANVYVKMGSNVKAIYAYQEVYQKRQSILGDDHPQTIRILDLIAQGWMKELAFDKALEYAEKAYEQKISKAGFVTLSATDSLVIISKAKDNLGRPYEAQNALRLVYDTRLKYGGENLANTYELLTDLIKLYDTNFNTEEATKLYQILLFTPKVSGNVREQIDILHKISSLNYQWFAHKEGESVFSRILEKMKTIPDVSEEVIFIIEYYIAVYQYNIGKYSGDVNIFLRYYEWESAQNPLKYSKIVQCLRIIAKLYFQKDQFERTIFFNKKIVEILATGNYYNGLVYLKALRDIVKLSIKMSDFDTAFKYQELVCEHYKRKHEDLIGAYITELKYLVGLAINDQDAKIRIYCELLEACEKAYGVYHEKTLEALEELADSYLLVDLSKTLELRARLLNLTEEMYGEESEKTIDQANKLAVIQKMLGDN